MPKQANASRGLLLRQEFVDFETEGYLSEGTLQRVGDLGNMVNLTEIKKILATVGPRIVEHARCRLNTFNVARALDSHSDAIGVALGDKRDYDNYLNADEHSNRYTDDEKDRIVNIRERLQTCIVVDCICQRLIYEMARLSKKNSRIRDRAQHGEVSQFAPIPLYQSVERDFDYVADHYKPFRYRTSESIRRKTGVREDDDVVRELVGKHKVFQEIADYMLHMLRLTSECYNPKYVRIASKRLMASVTPSKESIDSVKRYILDGIADRYADTFETQDAIVVAMVADIITQFIAYSQRRIDLDNEAEKERSLNVSLRDMPPAADMLESMRMLPKKKKLKNHESRKRNVSVTLTRPVRAPIRSVRTIPERDRERPRYVSSRETRSQASTANHTRRIAGRRRFGAPRDRDSRVLRHSADAGIAKPRPRILDCRKKRWSSSKRSGRRSQSRSEGTRRSHDRSDQRDANVGIHKTHSETDKMDTDASRNLTNQPKLITEAHVYSMSDSEEPMLDDPLD